MGGYRIMFKYKNVREQLKEEQNKNLILNDILLQMQANVDYIAMLEDIELEEEEQNDVAQIPES